MIAKTRLRETISAKRRALDPQWINAASLGIVERLVTQDAFKSAKTMALYKAIAGEVDLVSLFTACWELGKRTCIPVFNKAQKGYEMAEIKADTRFVTGNYGIQEPQHPVLVELNQINLILVPGVAFDPEGNRLGRGGGYYDRLLDGFAGRTAAVAFDFQLLPRIPHDAHDQPVDCIVTESKVVNVCNEH